MMFGVRSLLVKLLIEDSIFIIFHEYNSKLF